MLPRHRFQDLSHFTASWLIVRGFSPKQPGRSLGHGSIQMVFCGRGRLLDDPDDEHRMLKAGQLVRVG